MEIRKYAINLHRSMPEELSVIKSILKQHGDDIYEGSCFFIDYYTFGDTSKLAWSGEFWFVSGIASANKIILTPQEFIEKFGKQSLKGFYGN